MLQPVGAYGQQVLIAVDPSDAADQTPQRFELWSPTDDTFAFAWIGQTGHQDVVAGIDGDWAATVRTTLSLPFAEWELILRNLRTGEVRVVARGDPALGSVKQLKPDLPLGLAPYPSIEAGRITWEQYDRTGDRIAKRVMLQDVASGLTRVLASVADATREDLRLPAVAGDTVAWIHRRFAEASSEIVVHDLRTGMTRALATRGNPWSLALLQRGAALVWDDALQAKHYMRLDDASRVQFAGMEGWGVLTNGTQVSWSPAAAQGGQAGYFDAPTMTVRLVERAPGTQTNVGLVMGGWFVWQELHLAPAANPGMADSAYYFLPLAEPR